MAGYFLALAGLFALDAGLGGHLMARAYIPGLRPAGADRLIAWVMALLALSGLTVAMALLSLGAWLFYFGLLPLIFKRLAEALARRGLAVSEAKGA